MKHSAGIELLEAGREPRRPLRYAFTAGRTEKLKVVTGTTLGLEIGGQKLESPSLPDVELGISIQVLEVRPDGSARREIALERVELGAGGSLDLSKKRELESMLGAITKLKGRDAIDQRGRMRSLELDAGALDDPQLRPVLGQLLDQLQQSLGQMGAPFPEEPLGIGARWAVTSEVNQQGMKLQQVATYELTELSGDKGAARIELKQYAPRGSVNPPGLPPNVKAEIVSLDSRGLGKLRFDLKRSVPEGQLRTKAKIKVRTTQAGKHEETTMDLDVRVRFVPQK